MDSRKLQSIEQQFQEIISTEMRLSNLSPLQALVIVFAAEYFFKEFRQDPLSKGFRQMFEGIVEGNKELATRGFQPVASFDPRAVNRLIDQFWIKADQEELHWTDLFSILKNLEDWLEKEARRP